MSLEQQRRLAVRMLGRDAREEGGMFVQQQQQQQQRRSVNGTPFLHADPTLPNRYHPYPQVPTELHPNYAPNFSNCSAKVTSSSHTFLCEKCFQEGGYGIENGGSGGGGGGGVLYGMEGLGHHQRQLPAEFVMSQTEPWGYVANGTESRIVGRGSLNGPERPSFPSQASYSPPSFMNSAGNHARNHPSSARMQHQQIYSNGSANYLSAQAIPAPTRADHAMRVGSGIEGFFASSRPDQAQPMLHPVQHTEGKSRQPSYSNKHANWPTQQTTTRHGGMVSHGVPAPYDPGYAECIGRLHPSHRQEYDVPRTVMPSQQPIAPQQRTRAVPGNPYDYHPSLTGMRPGAVYARDSGSMMHTRMERVPQRRFPSPEKEMGRKYISPLFHELEECYAFCTKAYETHQNRRAGACAAHIRKTIQAIKGMFSGRNSWPRQEEMHDVMTKIQKRMFSLIGETKQIREQLESPQSINSTANAALEEQEEIPCLSEPASRIPSRRRINYTAAAAGHQRVPPPVISSSKSHMKERETRAGNIGLIQKDIETCAETCCVGNRDEVIVLDNADDADDVRRQKEHLHRQRGPKSPIAFQLQPRLGNDPLPHPGIKTQPPLSNPAAHHDMRRKRELVSPERGYTTDVATSPRSRDIRRKLNPAAATVPNRDHKVQAFDVHQTASNNGREIRGDVTPPLECAASNDDDIVTSPPPMLYVCSRKGICFSPWRVIYRDSPKSILCWRSLMDVSKGSAIRMIRCVMCFSMRTMPPSTTGDSWRHWHRRSLLHVFRPEFASPFPKWLSSQVICRSLTVGRCRSLCCCMTE